MSFLEIKALSKAYNKNQVFKDFNLSLERGQILALLGPNGCGKTTLLKIIGGLLRDYEGSIEIDGEPRNYKQNERIVYQADSLTFASWKSPADLVTEHARFFSNFQSEKALSLLDDIGIDRAQKLRHMSKGMQEKVQIIMAISRKADLYLLDEPIAGVDPASRELILSIILDNLDENSLAIVSTHLVSEIEQIFDQVIFLKEGEILAQITPDQLRADQASSINDFFIKNYGLHQSTKKHYLGQK